MISDNSHTPTINSKYKCDIFISAKFSETDENGNEVIESNGSPKLSPDYYTALEVYTFLREKYPYLRIFFVQSKEAKAILGEASNTNEVIFSALYYAKLFILVGSSRRYIENYFVRREWGTYIDLLLNDTHVNRHFLLWNKGINQADIPGTLKVYPSIDANSIVATNQLNTLINKAISLKVFNNQDQAVGGLVNSLKAVENQKKEEPQGSVNKTNDLQKDLNEVYYALNTLRFETAIEELDTLRTIYPDSSEVYFLSFLAENHICYFPTDNGSRIPSLCDVMEDSVFTNTFAKKAMVHAESKQIRDSYQKVFDEIEKMRLDILKGVKNPDYQYDIYICAKITALDENGKDIRDANGRPVTSKDYETAQELYDFIRQQNPRLRVFFSQSADAKAKMAGNSYESVIFSAIHSAKAFILVAESRQSIDWRFIRNEWKNYLMLMKREKPGEKNFLVWSKTVKDNDLPSELRTFNYIKATLINATAQLKSFLNHAVPKKEESSDNSGFDSLNKETLADLFNSFFVKPSPKKEEPKQEEVKQEEPVKKEEPVKEEEKPFTGRTCLYCKYPFNEDQWKRDANNQFVCPSCDKVNIFPDMKKCFCCEAPFDKSWTPFDEFGNYICPYCGSMNDFSEE